MNDETKMPTPAEVARPIAMAITPRHAARCYYMHSSSQDGDECARCDCGAVEDAHGVHSAIAAAITARDAAWAAREEALRGLLGEARFWVPADSPAGTPAARLYACIDAAARRHRPARMAAGLVLDGGQ